MNYNELKYDSPTLPIKTGLEESSVLTYNLTILVYEEDERVLYNNFIIINLQQLVAFILLLKELMDI